jgi:hypothetical protein
MPVRNLVLIVLTSAVVMGVTGALLTEDLRAGLALSAGALMTAALFGILSRRRHGS